MKNLTKGERVCLYSIITLAIIFIVLSVCIFGGLI